VALSILETLWKPNPKDAASGIQQRRIFQSVAAVSAAVQFFQINMPACPPDVARVITHVGALGIPAGGQQYVSSYAALIQGGSGGGVLAMAGETPVLGVGFNRASSFPVDWIQRVGDFVQVTVFFNTGSLANGATAFCWGYELPIGNLQ
jgi:hypothetical protein